jgi:molecular chaperone DnaK
VADEHGDMIWFFEKDTPLPTEEKTITLETTKELKKGKEGDAINIPVVQGNENKAYLNRVIKILKVHADRVSTTIPEGSNVEVSIKMDESRKVSVDAWLVDYDVEVSATVVSRKDPTPEELNKEFKRVQDECKKLEEVGNYSGKVKQVVEEVRRKKMIEEIERLVSQG